MSSKPPARLHTKPHRVVRNAKSAGFGIYNMLLGYLILKSTFLPRVLGLFLAFAGLTYQTFLWPPLAERLFPYLLAPAGGLGERSIVFWLLVFGVNVQRWKEQALGAGVHPAVELVV
jgi:hypothetical protein